MARPVAKHAGRSAKRAEPHAAYMSTKPATRKTKPMCIIIRYVSAARSTSARWASNNMSRKDAMVISSHASRNENPPLDITTIIIESTSMVSET